MVALESKIDAVTVYRSGARVTRLAELSRAGDRFPDSVTLAGLPMALEDSSVRARVLPVEGSNGAGLPVAADVRVTLDVARGDEHLRPAEEGELRDARVAAAEQAELVAQIEREVERLSHLDLQARARSAADEPPPTSPLAARLELLELRESRWARLAEELEEARIELTRRQRALRLLEDRDRRAGSARKPRENELRKCAVISLRGGSVAAARLALEYRVPGARWAPAYVARLDAAGVEVDLAVRAMIAQKTGEDWRDAAVRLVTAPAETITELPELHSLRIGRRQREPESTGWRPPPVGAELLYEDFDRAFAGGAPPPEGIVEEYDDVITRPDEEDDEQDEVTTVAFEPEPEVEVARTLEGAPQAAPAPAPMMPAAAKSVMSIVRAGGLEEPRRRERPSKADTMIFGGAPGGLAEIAAAPEEPEEPAAIRADDALLDYGSLRMAAADSPERGKLHRQSWVAGYLEDLRARDWQIDFNLRSVLTAAKSSARTLEAVGPPPKCSFEFPDDYDYSYFADSRLDIPSDGEFHSVALTGRSGRCKLVHVVAPRESTDVFRVARIDNPLDGPLIAGPIDVYLGGEFLLATRLGFTPPGGTLRFGLGVDQAVKVVRNTQFREDTTGLLGGSRELHHQIRVEVQNHRDRSIDLEVRERVPVVREDEDDIRVELGPVSPAWQAYRPGEDELGNKNLKGGYRWRLSLERGARAELRAGYTIRISSKNELVGGNRRES